MNKNEQAQLENNFEKFVDGLEELSKKYGIAVQVVGGLVWDLDGFQKIEYKRDFWSGDLMPKTLTFNDGSEIK